MGKGRVLSKGVQEGSGLEHRREVQLRRLQELTLQGQVPPLAHCARGRGGVEYTRRTCQCIAPGPQALSVKIGF